MKNQKQYESLIDKAWIRIINFVAEALHPLTSKYKYCKCCHNYKPKDLFHNQNSSSDGKQSYCKVCRRDYSK